MRRLAQFEPLLVGGVAAGWATEHSDIRLELVADDRQGRRDRRCSTRGVAYAALPARDGDAPTQLRIESRRGAIRACDPSRRRSARNRPRHERGAAARRRRARGADRDEPARRQCAPVAELRRTLASVSLLTPRASRAASSAK